MISSFLLTFLGIISIYLYFKLKKWIHYFDSRGIHSNDWKFPFGDLTGVGTKVHFVEGIKNVYDNFKDMDSVCGFYSHIMPVIIPTNLDIIKDILIKDFNSFTDRGIYHNEEKDPLSCHLLAIEGEKWRSMRNKLSPTFTSGKMKMMFETISDKGNDFAVAIRKTSGTGPVEIKNICIRFTTDVIGSCAFGLEYESLLNGTSDLIEVSKEIFDISGIRLLYILFLTAFPGVSKKLGLRSLPKEVETYFMSTLRSTINHREVNHVKRNDFLNLLIQLKNKGYVEDEELKPETDTTKLSFNEIAAQAFVFLFAGFETSSTLMSFMFFELAANKDVQEKARDEVLRVIKNHDGKITYEAVLEMTYLNQVMNETLRKYPPVGTLIRVANHDYEIKDHRHVIEKGTHVFIPVYAIHHDTRFYEEPSKFDPNRFSPEEVALRHKMAFLPFGEGNRNCIGNRFGMMQSKFGLALALSKFKFELNKKTNNPLKLSPRLPVMEDKNGIWLNFEEI